MTLLFQHATIITANATHDILDDASLLVVGSKIVAINPAEDALRSARAEVIDASGLVIIPGFVQTHVHLCQTLFRGLADDLQLLDWLQKRIFPLEASHTAGSMYRSALLGIAELVRSGTTTILDMGSINFEEEVIRAIGETGLRACAGKAMMDVNEIYPGLRESTDDAIRSSRKLAEKWHNSFDGRVRYAVAPRFVLSCSDKLLREAHEMTRSFDGMLYHTHASENKNEVQAVRQRCKMDNIEFLHHLGVLSERACLAHCIHVNTKEVDMLAETRSAVTHCPSSNLKLGSGIANVAGFLQRGIRVGLGADGAPCNNTLDMFQEMRLASLLQKPFHGPTSMPAEEVFHLATIGGARALGMEQEIGSIEPGKKADLVVLDLRRVWNPAEAKGRQYSTIVYSGSPENVHSVMIDGKWVYRNKALATMDECNIVKEGKRELKSLLERVTL